MKMPQKTRRRIIRNAVKAAAVLATCASFCMPFWVYIATHNTCATLLSFAVFATIAVICGQACKVVDPNF